MAATMPMAEKCVNRTSTPLYCNLCELHDSLRLNTVPDEAHFGYTICHHEVEILQNKDKEHEGVTAYDQLRHRSEHFAASSENKLLHY